MELIIDNVQKYYGEKRACAGISLRLHKGVYGLLGANGAGKTTLMRIICGLLNPTSGTVTFDGRDVSTRDYRTVLGYLPQDFGYYPEFTARDFMMYIAALKGLPKGRARDLTASLLKTVSLENEAKKKIKTFSGGMRQRLGIAQALLNDPKILILDEPTSGLDPKERVRFRNLISQMGAERIVMLSTHIVSDVENIANTILVMKSGRVIHEGAPEKIIGAIAGKVWECTVPAITAGELSDRYTVVNTRPEGEKVFLRLVCDEKPVSDAAPVTGTLEDLYLYYFSSGEDRR